MSNDTLVHESLELHPLLESRRSTRAYDPEFVIDEASISRLLDAARWSASASNSQPWRLIVARRGTPSHSKVVATLMDFNTVWAPNASVLIVFAAYTPAEPAQAARWTQYDAGQAAAQLTVQALHEGLAVHQLGGFFPDRIIEAFDLPEGVVPIAIAAVGKALSADQVPAELLERESAPRLRKALDEIVLVND